MTENAATTGGVAPTATEMEMGGAAVDGEPSSASSFPSSRSPPLAVPAGSGSNEDDEGNDDGGDAIVDDDDDGDEYGALMTISEAAEMAAGGWTAPAWARFVMEGPFRMRDPAASSSSSSSSCSGRRRRAPAAPSAVQHEGGEPKYLNEATGWAMDSAARGPMNQIGSFVGSAVIQMAVASAGCENANQCSVAGGIKPSSLLTLMSAVVGVVAAVVMPIAGAVIDHTRHRKLVASASAFFVVLFTGMQIAMSASKLNWLYVLILDALQAFCLLVHTNALFAYLPELTLVQASLPAYTSHFNIRQFLAQLSLSIIVIVAGSVWAGHEWRTPLQNSVATAQLAVAVAFTYGVVFFGYAWTFLFRKRPALSTVPAGSNLVTTGFLQVARTSRKIWADYRALRWFMFSLLWSPEAGAGVVQSVAVTFLVVTIKFATVDIAIVSLIVMVSTIIGSFVSRWVCMVVTPLTSYRVSMFMLGVSIAISALYLDGPPKRVATFGLSSTWGFFMGWTYPSQKVLFVTLSPKGQETEIMGCYFFASKILGWLLPLVFTIMNENGVNMRWGFGMVSFFCTFAVLCTFPMGNYREATELVARESQAKFRSVLKAASQHENYSSGFAGIGNRSESSVRGEGKACEESLQLRRSPSTKDSEAGVEPPAVGLEGSVASTAPLVSSQSTHTS